MQAMALNDEQALEILERPSTNWRGHTAVDVAIFGNSTTFIEQCCGAALDYRWSGDLGLCVCARVCVRVCVCVFVGLYLYLYLYLCLW